MNLLFRAEETYRLFGTGDIYGIWQKGELTVCFAQGIVLFYLELEKITNYLEHRKLTD
jgi:hypothetical protein